MAPCWPLPPADDLKEIQPFKELFWLAHPRDHHFYNQDEVSLADLKDEKVLLLSENIVFPDRSLCRD